MNNFHYGQVLLKLLYDLDVDTEDYEELALLAWNLIGNKNVLLYKCLLPVEHDNSVTLPCNAVEGKIEAVTIPHEDWNSSTNYSDYGDIDSSIIENNIESTKVFSDLLYAPGKLIKYRQVGDKLYFSHNYGAVNILYKGIILDEEGLPEISDKEASAIATYVAYVLKFKAGLSTNNLALLLAASTLKVLWGQMCDLARVLELNLNAVNNILDAKTSWNRKIFNKSYKGVI